MAAQTRSELSKLPEFMKSFWQGYRAKFQFRGLRGRALSVDAILARGVRARAKLVISAFHCMFVSSMRACRDQASKDTL